MMPKAFEQRSFCFSSPKTAATRPAGGLMGLSRSPLVMACISSILMRLSRLTQHISSWRSRTAGSRPGGITTQSSKKQNRGLSIRGDKETGQWSVPMPFWGFSYCFLFRTPAVVFIWTKAGEMNLQCVMLPNWTDCEPWSWTNLMLNSVVLDNHKNLKKGRTGIACDLGKMPVF